MTSMQQVAGPVELRKRTRQRELAELVLGYGLILAVIWTPRPWQRGLYALAATAIAGMMAMSFRSLAAMGMRRDNLVRSIWIPALAVVMAAGLIGWAAAHGGVRGGGTASWYITRYWGYAVWALVQQLLLQDFFLSRMMRLLPGRRGAAIAAAAGVFAAAHLPNPILTPMTLVCGVIACAAFVKYRNIWTLAMAHALLGVTLAITMPAALIRNMRVGLGYLEYPRTHSRAMHARRFAGPDRTQR